MAEEGSIDHADGFLDRQQVATTGRAPVRVSEQPRIGGFS
jgi:hypothetical protein